MRLGRIVGVVLSILVLAYFGIQKLNAEEKSNNPFELIADSGYLSDGNIANLNDQVLKGNDSNVEIIEFTNIYNYPVELNKNDITITCNGTGENKDEDEALVSNNYKLNAMFSDKKNGQLSNSLLVKQGNKAFIYVMSEYQGALPSNEVACKYSIQVSYN